MAGLAGANQSKKCAAGDRWSGEEQADGHLLNVGERDDPQRWVNAGTDTVFQYMYGPLPQMAISNTFQPLNALDWFRCVNVCDWRSVLS